MAEELPKWTAQKIFILVMVVVFFVSSFGLTGLVVWEQINGDDTNTTATQPEEVKEEDMLQGTQLTNFTPTENIETLTTEDIVVGTGKEATKDSTVVAHYTGAVAATGVIFQSSLDTGSPATFPLSGSLLVGKKVSLV